MAPSIRILSQAEASIFYDMAGSTDKTLKLYEGGFHDLLKDVDKETVISDIKSWIKVHLLATAGH